MKNSGLLFTLLILLFSLSAKAEVTLTLCASDQLKPGCPDITFADGNGFIAESFGLPNPKLLGKKLFVDASGDISIGGVAFQADIPLGFYAAFDNAGHIKTSYSGTLGGLTLSLKALPLKNLHVSDILVDASNNVYISGLHQSQTFPIGITAKQASTKEEYLNMQIVTLDDQQLSGDQIISMGFDAEGRLLGLGKSSTPGGNRSMLYRYVKNTETLKWEADTGFKSEGSTLGYLLNNAELGTAEFPKKLLIDKRNNVFVVGFSIEGDATASTLAYNAYIIKFDSQTNTITHQVKQIAAISGSDDEFYLMEKLGNLDAEFDSNGNIVLVGMKNDVDKKRSLFIHRYDSNLNSESQEILLSTAFSLSGIVIDKQDAIIAAGLELELKDPLANPVKLASYSTNGSVIKLSFSLETQTYDYDINFGTDGRLVLDYSKSAGLFDVGLSNNQIVVAGGAIGDTANLSSNLFIGRLLNEVCGNGVIEGSEECDDANLVDGDKCSASCDLEEEASGTLTGNPKAEGGCALNPHTTLSISSFILSVMMMGLGIGLMKLAIFKR